MGWRAAISEAREINMLASGRRFHGRCDAAAPLCRLAAAPANGTALSMDRSAHLCRGLRWPELRSGGRLRRRSTGALFCTDQTRTISLGQLWVLLAGTMAWGAAWRL